MYVFGFTHNFPPALGQKVITEACGAPLKDCCLVGFLVRVFSLTCLLIGYRVLWGFPGGTVVKIFSCQCRRCRGQGFDLWVRKIPWRRKWQPAPVFLPGKSHGQKSLAAYCQWDHKELDMTERTYTHTQVTLRRPT